MRRPRDAWNSSKKLTNLRLKQPPLGILERPTKKGTDNRHWHPGRSLHKGETACFVLPITFRRSEKLVVAALFQLFYPQFALERRRRASRCLRDCHG